MVLKWIELLGVLAMAGLFLNNANGAIALAEGATAGYIHLVKGLQGVAA